MIAYRVKGLTKIYEPHGPLANDKIDLEIAQGVLFGLFGPNGAGKTTLVKQLMGLLKPTSGRIELFGHDVIAHPELVPCYVGYYSQRVLALRAHKLWEVPYITGLLRGQSARDAKRQVWELLERFELLGLADRLMAHLSGGEQRLAALLATFMGYPKVLILDEPTNELDPMRRRRVWEYLRELNQELGVTIIFVTHNLLEAEAAVDQVGIIDRGRLVALGTPGELKRAVQNTVRMEVRLREGAEADGVLSKMPGAKRLRQGWWQITAPKESASQLLAETLGELGFDMIDDFRLITPTLEDVYIQITGRIWDDNRAEEK